VNEAITRLPEELKLPFPGAADGLAAAAKVADVAVVSSANRDAVEEEWEKYGLLPYTDILLAQDCGSKSHCIAKMLEFGYDKDHVLMVGDAPGDCDAAEKNKVHYYPILVNHEKESWEEAVAVAFPKLRNGEYAPYGAEKKQEFLENLGG
jgi:phosphoglycolate phosphatase-like HAD superfamily hydrolase